MAKEQRIGRQKAVSELKRSLIMDAARQVFESEGLDGASLRAIATAAGYTPAALYFHFESKEAIYAEVLCESLTDLARPSLVPLRARGRRRTGSGQPPWHSFGITPTIPETSISASICF